MLGSIAVLSTLLCSSPPAERPPNVILVLADDLRDIVTALWASGAEAIGPADIEAYTVMFSREGEPERAIASCPRSDGRRAWGVSQNTGATGGGEHSVNGGA